MQSHRAFTLLDLLALVLMVAIVGFFLLSGPHPSQEAARRASCMNNVRQIGLAMFQYAGDHDDKFMPLVDAAGNMVPGVDNQGRISPLLSRTGFSALLKEGYLTTRKVFICPSSQDQVDTGLPTDYKDTPLAKLLLTDSSCSYGWDPTKKHSADASCAIVADKPLANPPGPAGDIKDNSPNHGGDPTHAGEGQNVFYNDGHVKWGTTPCPDSGDDKDIYLGDAGYEKSTTDAKIVR